MRIRDNWSQCSATKSIADTVEDACLDGQNEFSVQTSVVMFARLVERLHENGKLSDGDVMAIIDDPRYSIAYDNEDDI